MDDKVSLYVLGLSYSQLQSGAYALILAETKGPRRIPVVIGAAEAQSIAITLEGIRTPRPLTHDLFVSFAHAFGVKLQKVFIYRFEDGIFSSEMTFTDGERVVTIDARTSDAIAIALRSKAPIFTTREIVRAAGFIIEDDRLTRADDADYSDSSDNSDYSDELPEQPMQQPKPEKYSIEQLEKELADLIDKEDYEEAARISEILQRKKENRDNSAEKND